MKSVFITGASRGIGQAICGAFERAGYQTVCPTRDELDLSSADSISRFLETNVTLAPDILINNAGENRIFPIEDLPLDYWQRILDVNLTSTFRLIQHFAPRMATKGWGRIVNIGSVYGLVSRNGRAAYTTSKAALNGLTQTAALEFGPSNVLVNCVCPGFVETDLTKQNNPSEQIEKMASQVALRRLAQPAEIAELVFFLASEKNTYLTGQAVVIDGGFIMNRNVI